MSIRILLEFDHIISSVGDRLATARGRAPSGSGKIGERHDQHIFLPKAYGDITTAYGNRGCVHGFWQDYVLVVPLPYFTI